MHDATTDPILLEVLKNQLQGVVEEMGQTVMRCGHTVFVKETQDFVVALVTPEGEVAACSRRVGIWIGIGQDFEPVISAGGPYAEGDVWFTNDPEQSRGLVTHLPDVFCWRPIFHAGELVCFAAAFIHCTDVGGLVPGAVAPTAVDQFQEGIVIPVTRLVENDRIRTEVLGIFLRNSRIPEKNRGDLLAVLGALRRAETRVQQLAEKFGATALRAGLRGLLAYAERQARAVIRAIPSGDYAFWDYLEGDFTPDRHPIRIKLVLRVRGDELTLDFTETDPQVAAAFNIPSYATNGHYLLVMGVVNYMRTVSPDITYNSGLVRPVKVVAPRGSLLNPEPHAASGARQATFFRVADVVLGALGLALRSRMPAAGCGQGSIMLLSIPDLRTGKRLISIVQPLVGGSGARPAKDGTDGVDFTTGFYRNIPTEVLESEIPVLVERYGLRADSGGPGRTRGGAGLRYSLRVLGPGAVVTARALERYHFQPWGREGGLPGDNGRTLLEEPGQAPREIGKIDVLEPGPGAVVHMETAGGGGFGPPWERDPAAVLRDVEDGHVTPEQAETAYGVVIVNGVVDAEATAARRRTLSAGAGSPEPFQFGRARQEYEARRPDALQSAVVAATAGLPAAIRQHVRRRLLDELAQWQLVGATPDALRERVGAILSALDPTAGIPDGRQGGS